MSKQSNKVTEQDHQALEYLLKKWGEIAKIPVPQSDKNFDSQFLFNEQKHIETGQYYHKDLVPDEKPDVPISLLILNRMQQIPRSKIALFTTFATFVILLPVTMFFFEQSTFELSGGKKIMSSSLTNAQSIEKFDKIIEGYYITGSISQGRCGFGLVFSYETGKYLGELPQTHPNCADNETQHIDLSSTTTFLKENFGILYCIAIYSNSPISQTTKETVVNLCKENEKWDLKELKTKIQTLGNEKSFSVAEDTIEYKPKF